MTLASWIIQFPSLAPKCVLARPFCNSVDTTPSWDLLDNLGREAVAAIADLGHHQWLRLKSLNGKPTNNVTRPVGGLV